MITKLISYTTKISGETNKRVYIGDFWVMVSMFEKNCALFDKFWQYVGTEENSQTISKTYNLSGVTVKLVLHMPKG